ncbi:MAG: ABC transporter permease [Acidobacteria bacterium]|nr:ABC transporter permease [Acidobacteriota bacterium]
MDSLIVANLRQRPTRAIVSIAGVALGVILILINTGLVRGMLNDRVRREQGVGAEIQFGRKGSILSPSAVFPTDARYAEKLKKIAGVQEASPIGLYTQRGKSGLGFEVVDGIDYPSYTAISGLKIVEGRLFQAENEVIIDDFKAFHSKLTVGSEIEVFGRQMKVAGVYTPQIGSRIKMPLSYMQSLLGYENKCTFLMVKVNDPGKQAEVQERINGELPGNAVVLTRDLGLNAGREIPGLNGFVRAILALSMVVSCLVILLAMYTTITERTREIGILKSLGASKQYIISVIEKEALLISLIGVVAGLVVAMLSSWVLERATTLHLEFHWQWIVAAAAIGLLAGALGALYPAVRAAKQDPVKALSYD